MPRDVAKIVIFNGRPLQRNQITQMVSRGPPVKIKEEEIDEYLSMPSLAWSQNPLIS